MKLINLTKVFSIFFSVIITFSACSDDTADADESNDKSKSSSTSSWRSNVIASIDGSVALIASLDFMQILDKSSIMDADIIPDMYKSMAMGYIDSENLGIQLEGNNHVVVVMDDNAEFDYAFLMANVLDASKIADNLHAYIGGRRKKEDGYEFLKTSEGIVFGWDSDHIIAAVNNKGRSSSDINQLKTVVKQLLDAKKSDSDVKENLMAYLNRDDDMNMFIDMETYMHFIQSIQMPNKIELNPFQESLMENLNYTTVTSLNFNDGEIVFKGDMKSNDGSALSFFNDQPVADEYLGYVSNNNKLLSCAFANLDIKWFSSLMKNIISQEDNVYSDFKESLESLGLSEDEIFHIFNGELSISLIDVQPPANKVSEDFGEWDEDFFDNMDDFEYSSNDPIPNILITLGIDDQSALMKLMANAPVNVIENQVIDIENDFHLLIKNNKLFVGSNKTILDDINAFGSLKSFSKITSIDYPVYGYVNTDISSLPDGISSMLNEEEGLSETANDILNLFSSIEFKGSNNEMSYEIKMSNDSENALKQIVDLIIELAMKNNPELMFM